MGGLPAGRLRWACRCMRSRVLCTGGLARLPRPAQPARLPGAACTGTLAPVWQGDVPWRCPQFGTGASLCAPAGSGGVLCSATDCFTSQPTQPHPTPAHSSPPGVPVPFPTTPCSRSFSTTCTGTSRTALAWECAQCTRRAACGPTCGRRGWQSMPGARAADRPLLNRPACWWGRAGWAA